MECSTIRGKKGKSFSKATYTGILSNIGPIKQEPQILKGIILCQDVTYNSLIL